MNKLWLSTVALVLLAKCSRLGLVETHSQVRFPRMLGAEACERACLCVKQLLLKQLLTSGGKR